MDEESWIKEALSHFGITMADIKDTPFKEISNNTDNRKAYGVERAMQGETKKKVRIIIDYDADYPIMIHRVYKGGEETKKADEIFAKSEKTAHEVYQHYGLEKDKKEVELGKISGVDFLVGREKDIDQLTRNMAGFGTEKSQRVTIEYDKGYGYFIVKRSQMEYGASKETPQNPVQSLK